MTAPSKATLQAPDGSLFHVSFEDGALWVHGEGAPGRHVSIIAFEPNAANEGWLQYVTRAAVQSQPLARRPRP